MNILRPCFLLFVITASGSSAVFAWIYPEHRDISIRAVEMLDPQHQEIFDRLWQTARIGREGRLCLEGADTGQGLTPECIDWAALAAISGDHSCSSQDLLDTVMETQWIITIADVAAQLKKDLAEIPVEPPTNPVTLNADMLDDAKARIAIEGSRADRTNALRVADTRMQRADAQYVTRASANNAHFLLARETPNQTGDEYADKTLHPGSEINAIGVYAWFHLSALQKAGQLANDRLTGEQRQALTRAALFDEAFALHFLQDSFAAGHVAGTWGNDAQRKGTHDFYNQNGLETFTWGGSSTALVLMGDAHMRPQDADVTAAAVEVSLRQFLDVAAGSSELGLPLRTNVVEAPDGFNVCQNTVFPERDKGMEAAGEYRTAFEETLNPTPVPRLGPGLGAMPRFHSELGPFIGLAGSLDTRVVNGGFDSSQTSDGWVPGLEVAFWAGFGLEGALGEASDGLIYSAVGYRIDAASSNLFSSNLRSGTSGDLSAAIPSRSGLTLRFRMPFYLVPADLLLLSPLYLINPDRYLGMAVTAANGGLIPWQTGFATAIGRFQFVLGRELGITFYGLDGDNQLLIPGIESGGFGRLVNFKSTSWEIPILEYRPYRSFSSNHTSSAIFQLYGGVDVPRGATVVLPTGGPPVDLGKIWFVGVRMTFDWRFYFKR